MPIAFELLAVFFIAILPALLACIYISKSKAEKFEKVFTVGSLIHFLSSLGNVFLMVYIAMNQQAKLLSLGLDFEKISRLFIGVVIFSVFCLIYTGVYRLIFGKKPLDRSNKLIQRILAAKTLLQKTIQITVYLIPAISEELVFRGYLILLWGQRTDSIIICAVVSCLIFITLHLYQGKEKIIYYILLSTLLTVSAVLSQGIWIPLGIHLYCNFCSILGVWITDAKERKKTQTKNAKVSKLAIIILPISAVSFIASIFLFAIPSVLTLIMSIFATVKIAKSKGTLSGYIFSIPAIVLSAIPILAISALFIIFFLVSQLAGN
ncbi:MAG: CPBP family intramembrane glutamic endopeptidase [Planctomycetota bacterium]|jgi:membrane protease YdiL (CAAX protease family)